MILLFIIIVPLVASIISFLIKRNMRLLSFITAGASIFEFSLTVAVVAQVIQKGIYSSGGYFSVDALGAVLMMLVAVVSALASWYSTGYLKVEMQKNIIGVDRMRQYFTLLHLFILVMFFAIMTTSPIFMWIAIEATTLSTAFLISFYNKPAAVEAAWKYLIINSVGLLLAFFGTLLFLYPAMHGGYRGIINWQILLSNALMFDPYVAKIAFIFVLIGFGTKVGLAPMHTWLPDAHSKAPAPISSLLSGILLNVAFLAVLRFKVVTDLAVGKGFSGNLLIFFGVLSIVVAAFSILTQKNYKRLLAYSSIEHMGVISLGFGFGGIGAFAGLLHMIYHSLAKSVLFLSAGNIFLKYSSTKIAKVKGMTALLPLTSVFFVIGFLAITGVPPFGIFVTEFLILSAGIKAHLIVVIIALSALALVFIGFLRHISSMLFGESEALNAKGLPMQAGENGLWTIIPIIILIALLVLLSFYIPAGLQLLLHSAVTNY